MLRNSAEALKIGGYFLVTVPNSYEIIKRLKQSKNKRSFGNSIYTITFDESFISPSHKPALFGSRYHFQLEDVVDCPEYLVYPPLLITMAKEVGLECILGPLPFADFMDSATRSHPNSIDLLRTMDALETWPAALDSRFPTTNHRNRDRSRSRSRSPVGRNKKCSDEKTLVADQDQDTGAYDHVKVKKDSLRLPVGTISHEEWEAFCTYCIFVFRKVVLNKS